MQEAPLQKLFLTSGEEHMKTLQEFLEEFAGEPFV